MDSDQHEVLFRLLAITTAGMRLTTADGTELLPDPRESLTLNLRGTGPVPGMPAVTVTKLLNDAVIAYRTHQSNDGTEDTDPYRSLRFDEFGPSQEAAHRLLETDEEQKFEELGPDCLQLSNSPRDDTDLYLNELGDDIRGTRETLVFTPNVYWRLAHNFDEPGRLGISVC